MHNRDMFMTEVDGKRLPAAIAGHPALELCNTWAGWNSPPGTGGDYLVDYDTLAVWAGDRAGLTATQTTAAREAAAAAGDQAARVLREARRFRSHLYTLLTGAASDSATAEVARLAHEARAAQRLRRAEDGTLSWQLPLDNPVRLPLLAAALAASDLLTGPQREAVHACPGHECGWLFLDPRGRRKWCVMAVCGNRAKARAHAERRAGPGASAALHRPPLTAAPSPGPPGAPGLRSHHGPAAAWSRFRHTTPPTVDAPRQLTIESLLSG